VLGRFEKVLWDFFGTENICLFNNGTLALQIALEGMGISGEVITTPFTFVATTHALFWNKIRPVFVDIEPDHYTIDPAAVEAAITPWTTAILAVHVYGYPCRVHALADIARRHNIALLFDAAHAFGVTMGGRPLSYFGDLSMYSFHATKLFHSIEGGMLTFRDSGLKSMFDYLKNFGFKNDEEVVMPGTNAKMNEMQALMGILVLSEFPKLIERSRLIDAAYREYLKDVPGIKLTPPVEANIKWNYAYEPVEVDEQEFGMNRDALFHALKEYNVFSRRYFYPLLTDYSCYQSVAVRDPLTVAKRVAQRILCLPNYADLTVEEVERICDIIKSIQKSTALPKAEVSHVARE
jgi:dTDP-4-amino-4,6-dideoxygalactose transaminase